eukprot:TRINITY_DN17816_c0_g3_i1.p1 TRINITY_DN17816_c0_g3~~TRINITY_DN17816_c0_g3_i1.p1  ORF type:complete len:193 (-),score=24.50 TRINITY_DN17816_c0_g3_i1:411-989(-)
MGSLMPGWDTVNSGQSYLERASSRANSDIPEWLNNLRVERTQSTDNAPNPLARTSSTSTNFAMRTSSEGGAQLLHHLGGAAGSKTVPHHRGKVVAPQPKLSLKRTSLPVNLAHSPRGTQPEHENEQGEEQNEETADHGLMSDHIRWWKAMESGYLNQAPDAEYGDYKAGSYVPQYDVARKHLQHKGTEQPAH